MVMKTLIAKSMFAAAALAAATCCSLTPGWAYGNAPWCAVIEVGEGSVVWDCQYRTVEECAPNVVAGNRGFCNLNPYGAGPGWSARPTTVARYKHPKRHAQH
jgi:hypothetical protein